MNRRTITAGITGAVALATAAALGVPGVASAATPTSFTKAQQTLETQLSNRVGQLGRLGADVAAAKALQPAHVTLLDSRLATETSNIDALVTKVPMDTTWAELRADQKAMLADNRVYAVMTPQVFQTIEADAIAAQVSTDQSSEATLQTSVTGLVGLPGYKTALNHYTSFVRYVNRAATISANVAVRVLGQVPADYPGDTHVFVNANHELLSADIDLAYASYDASIIGLASGGYTGS